MLGRTRVKWTILVAALAPVACAWADPAAADESAPPAEVRPSPLAGPQVSAESTRPTLLERDFNGTLKRLEIPADEAALAHVGLSPEARAKADAILAERAAILDEAVWDNLELLVRAQSARAAGDTAESMAILREFGEKLRPLRQRGRLGDELRAVMTPEQAAQHQALVRQYWEAIVDEGVAAARDANASSAPAAPRAGLRRAGQDQRQGNSRAQVFARESLLALGQEITRSYERQVASRQAELQEVVDRLSLSPEQDGKVRNIFIDHFQKYPTDAERRRHGAEVVRRVSAELSPEQRREFAAMLRDRLAGRDAGR